MKNLTAIIFMSLVLLFPWFLNAQKIEAEKVHELSKDAKNGTITSFKFDASTNSFYTVFCNEKKKTDVYELYQFDYDLKQVAHETLAPKLAKEKFGQAFYNDEGDAPWNNPKSLRVKEGLTGKLILSVGTISRQTKWRNGYKYYEFYFNADQEKEPTLNIPVEIPKGAPKGIAKMIQKQANKLYLVAYASDEPRDPNKGEFHFSTENAAGVKKDYLNASGDIIVIGYSQYATNNKMHTDFHALKFGASDLAQKAHTAIPFEYEMEPLFNKVLDDGSIGLVFIPKNAKKCAKPENPNAQEFTFVRIGKDANILQQTKFVSKARNWSVQDMVLTQNNEIYIYGLANAKNNNSYKIAVQLTEKFDNVQLVKIANNNIEFISSADLKEMASKVISPANQKKAKSYSGSGLILNSGMQLTTSSNVIFGGETVDHSAIHYFQFGKDGAFKAQYVINVQKPPKEKAVDFSLFPNVDGKTYSFFIGELESVSENGDLKFPSMTQIDPESQTINEIQTFGYGKSGKYFMDTNFPYLVINHGKELVFISRDKGKQNLYLARVKLGK